VLRMLNAEDGEELGVMGGEEDVEGAEELLMRYSKVSWRKGGEPVLG